MSANPFIDQYVKSANISDTDFNPFGDRAAVADDKTANMPDRVEVLILDAVLPPSPWSSLSILSDLSITSTGPTSPTTDGSVDPIKWNNADLMYLTSCLLPSDLIANRLIFTPPLEDLSSANHPIHLLLHKKMPVVPPPPEAFSKYAPIGTGRPKSRLLLAESSAECGNAAEARRSLAQVMLSNTRTVNDAVDRYNVLYTLHSIPTETLESVQRAMACMAHVTEYEWFDRLYQLRGIVAEDHAVDGVDASCEVEARLEIYLLDGGRAELEGWVRSVDGALEMGEGDRRVYAGVYGEAATFLWRAAEELRV